MRKWVKINKMCEWRGSLIFKSVDNSAMVTKKPRKMLKNVWNCFYWRCREQQMKNQKWPLMSSLTLKCDWMWTTAHLKTSKFQLKIQRGSFKQSNFMNNFEQKFKWKSHHRCKFIHLQSSSSALSLCRLSDTSSIEFFYLFLFLSYFHWNFIFKVDAVIKSIHFLLLSECCSENESLEFFSLGSQINLASVYKWRRNSLSLFRIRLKITWKLSQKWFCFAFFFIWLRTICFYTFFKSPERRRTRRRKKTTLKILLELGPGRMKIMVHWIPSLSLSS